MFFEQAEIDIATQLQTDLGAGVEVEVLPPTQAAYKRPFEKQRIEVCYKKSAFNPPSLMHRIVQDETMDFELVCISRHRTGDTGVLKLLADAFLSIIGFTPGNCRQIYAKIISDPVFEDNLWYYSATVACNTTLVEDFTEDEGPNVTQLNFEQE